MHVSNLRGEARDEQTPLSFMNDRVALESPEGRNHRSIGIQVGRNSVVSSETLENPFGACGIEPFSFELAVVRPEMASKGGRRR